MCYAQVGIGTITPSETLHVYGTTRIDNLKPNHLNSIKINKRFNKCTFQKKKPQSTPIFRH